MSRLAVIIRIGPTSTQSSIITQVNFPQKALWVMSICKHRYFDCKCSLFRQSSEAYV